jgi:hypothetical protein
LHRRGWYFICFFRLAALLVLMPALASAADFFPSGKVRNFHQFDELEQGVTSGGYPIFQGGRIWRVASGQTATNNIGIHSGTVQMISPIGGDYFAEMALTTS